MYRKLSNIDFSYFIGQKVEEVNTEKNIVFGMTFESGYLTIECPWRIRCANEVAIGYSDVLHSGGKFSHKNAEQILMGKRIVNIFHFEQISDLVVEFENGIYLELFHDSSYYEGWQLGTEKGLYLFTLPGGSYSD